MRRRQLGPFLCSWVFFWKSASLSAGVSPPPSPPHPPHPPPCRPGTRKAELCRTCGPPLCSRQVCRRPPQWARSGADKETVTPVFMKDPRQLLCPVTLSDQSPSDPWAEKSRRQSAGSLLTEPSLQGAALPGLCRRRGRHGGEVASWPLVQHTFLLEEDRGLSSVGFWQEPGPRRRGLQVPQPSRPQPFGNGDQFCGKQVCPQVGVVSG